MKKFFFILFSLPFFVFGQVPQNYYQGTEGLTGAQLKTALHNIIKNHTVLSYNSLYSYFQKVDVDRYYENDMTVLDIYSENPNGLDPYNFNYSQTCGSYNSEGDCFNREHSFPASWFNDASPMYSDMHHLFPTDGYVNNRRSNWPFGLVQTAEWVSMNGSKLGTPVSAIADISSKVFEPIDEFKGDLARVIFYMVTCYEDKLSAFNSPILTGNTYPAIKANYLQMLINWHIQDPVSQKEIDRNDTIFKYQGNRNPFVDNPQWVFDIWAPNTTIQPPSNFAATVDGFDVNLTWALNSSGDSVLLAYNSTNTFGNPSGSYNVNDNISGGGLVIYKGENTSFVHQNLSYGTHYYKIWSFRNGQYSSGVTATATISQGEQQCGTETFTNAPNTGSSYTDISWIGDNGVTWNAYAVRTDLTINGKCITFKKENTFAPYLVSTPISGGIGSITLTHKQMFTITGGKFSVYVNDNVVAADVVVTNQAQILNIPNINTPGTCTIKIVANNVAQVGIDDLSWTCYTSPTDLNQFEELISIYPNPSLKTVNVSANEPVLFIEVFNTYGTKIISFQNPDLPLQIQFEQKGTYFVRLRTNSKVITKKVMIF